MAKLCKVCLSNLILGCEDTFKFIASKLDVKEFSVCQIPEKHNNNKKCNNTAMYRVIIQP